MRTFVKFSIFIVTLAFASCEVDNRVQTVDPTFPKSANVLEMYEPNTEGTSITFSGKRQSISFDKKLGKYSIGDMVFTDVQVEYFKNIIANPQNSRTGLSRGIEFWRNGIVPYVINSSLPNQARVTNAIDYWQSVTGITFIQRTNQTDYVEFVVGSGCSSNVGKAGGRQLISLAADCSTGNAIHEIGHAVGLFHEHQRADRGNFININFGNIQSGLENNFQSYPELGRFGFEFGTLDFNSIMMYNSNAFTKNNQPTITRLDGTTFPQQRDSLTRGDIETVNRMYFSPRASTYNVLAEDNSDSDHDDVTYTVYVKFFSDDQRQHPTNLAVDTPVRFVIQNINGNGSSQQGMIVVPAGTDSYEIAQVKRVCYYDANHNPIGPCYSEYVGIISSPGAGAVGYVY